MQFVFTFIFMIGAELLSDGYEVTLVNDGPDNTLIEVIDTGNGDSILSLDITFVYSSHYHSCEYHDGYLYVIRRIDYDGYPDENWSDQLWRYSHEGTGIELFSHKGLDFRVSGDNSHIAVVSRDSLWILESEGGILETFETEQLSSVRIGLDVVLQPLEWSSNGLSFWGSLLQVPGPVSLFKLDINSMNPVIYDISSFEILDEYALQADSRMLTYSDYPAMHCSDELLEYQARGDTCHLFLYYLDEGWTELLAISSAREFKPVWISPDTLEFEDDMTGRRIRISI